MQRKKRPSIWPYGRLWNGKRLEQNSQFSKCNTRIENDQIAIGQKQISTHPIRMDDIKEEV